MAYLRLAFFAGIGAVLCVAFLPQTRWVFLNNLSAMSGGTVGGQYYGCLDPKKWSGRTPEQQLAKAIQAESPVWNHDSGRVALRPLEEFCRSHPNQIAGWAHLLRLAAKMPLHSPQEPLQGKRAPSSDPERSRRLNLMLEASSNGERLDSNNLYFSLMKAAVLETMGKHSEAQQTVIAATGKPDFNDYSDQEAEVVYDVALDTCGYRGAGMQVSVYAAILLPHIAALQSVLPYIAHDPGGRIDPKTQIALLEVAHTSAAKADVGIAVISMRNVFSRTLTGRTTHVKFDPIDLRARAVDLDKRLGSKEIERDLSDFDQVDFTRVERSQTGADFEQYSNSSSRPPLFAAIVLLGFVLAMPIIFLSVLISNAKLRLFKKKRFGDRPDVYSHVLWGVWTSILVLAIAGFVAAQILGRGPSVLAILGVLGATSQMALDQVAFGCLMLAGVAIVFLPRRVAAQPYLVAGVLMAVLPFLYLGSVIMEVQEDQGLKKVVVNIPTEVDVLRGNWGK